MKKNRSNDSLSSISSYSSDSDSEEEDDNDSDDNSKYKKRRNSRRSRGSQESNGQREKSKKRKRKQSINPTQSLKIDVNRQNQKRKSTIRPIRNKYKSVVFSEVDDRYQKKRSNSIDSPQKIQIRPKRRQLTYQYPGERNNEGHVFQFNQPTSNQNQRAMRFNRAKSINEMDPNINLNWNANQKKGTNVEFDDDFNIQTNASYFKTGSQTAIHSRKKSSMVDLNNISNESATSMKQLYPQKQLFQNQINAIYGVTSPNHQTTGVTSVKQIPEEDQEEIEMLKIEKHELKQQLRAQFKKQTTLEAVNLNLAKENDQQHQLLNNISNKLDLKTQINQTLVTDGNSNNVILKKPNQLSAFTKQIKNLKKQTCLSSITEFMKNNNPFNKQLKNVYEKIGDSGVIYFNFVIFIILLHITITITYLYFYFDYLINSSQRFDSNYQSFISYLMSHNYTSNTQVSYTTTFILMGVAQLIFTLVSYILQAREEVAYKALYGKQLKTFRMIFSWNMNIQESDYVERMKMTLIKRIKNILNLRKGWMSSSSDSSNSNQRKSRANDFQIGFFQKMIMILTIISLNFGFLISSLICTSLVANSSVMDTNNIIFFNSFLKSLAISLIAYTTGYFLKILTVCESWFHRSNRYLHTMKYSKMLLAHLSVISLFLYLNLSTILYSEESLQFLMFSTIPFKGNEYNCPEEQFSYNVLSMLIAYFFTSLIVQYIPTLKSILFNSICTSSKSLSPQERAFYNLSEFKPLDNIILLIVYNILSIALAPFFPFAFLASVVILFLLYFHQYFYIVRYKMASYEVVDRQQMNTLAVQLFTISNLIAFIFLGIILSRSYQKSLFDASSHDVQRTCGSFQSGETPLQLFQSFLEQNSFASDIYAIINFRPLLWALLIFFLFSFLIKNTTQHEWKNQYKSKSKELASMKTHFQDQVINLKDKITSVKHNITANNSPKNVQSPSNWLTPQREYYYSNSGKNSPAHWNLLQQNNQNQNNTGSGGSGNGSGQFNSTSSLNNLNNQQPKDTNNNTQKPSLFQRSQKQIGTYNGSIGLIQNPLESFSTAANRFQ